MIEHKIVWYVYDQNRQDCIDKPYCDLVRSGKGRQNWEVGDVIADGCVVVKVETVQYDPTTIPLKKHTWLPMGGKAQ